MRGLDFEKRVLNQLTELGWMASLTKTSGDYGADIIAKVGNNKLVVQCKEYSIYRSIGVSAVQEVYSAKSFYNCNMAAIIYEGNISRNALKMANQLNVIIFRIAELVPGCLLDKINDANEIELFRREQKKKLRERHIFEHNQIVTIIETINNIYNSARMDAEEKLRLEYEDHIKKHQYIVDSLSSKRGIFGLKYRSEIIDAKKQIIDYQKYTTKTILSGRWTKMVNNLAYEIILENKVLSCNAELVNYCSKGKLDEFLSSLKRKKDYIRSMIFDR